MYSNFGKYDSTSHVGIDGTEKNMAAAMDVSCVVQLELSYDEESGFHT